ncbi:filamentous hemagglutinin N-terminal domain-containing protein [Roseomonas fluvialis]|uniref:two-partner secretion domain-containing protein n=1 Tax=Roseomonas fluvialis TaxID=1750527 RepID=UPI001FCC4A98|nr:filamentous hemagglutinin N-terminal domain-containing protein [Roseomonas fluvialis]
MRRDWLLATTALLPIAAGPVMAQPAPNTGPTGGQVVAGQAGISRAPGRTTITQGTDRAAIDWQQFNVGSQHTVQFVQPSQGSWTLNRVVGPDPSVIAGRVQANGGVAIVNQSGMVFARGAQVNVGSLIASAPGITNENFMAGRMAFDQAARPGARVENRGTITVADRGLAALVGPGVSNSGVIRARLGRVALGAAETFVLDLAGDGLIGIDVTQAVRTAPSGGEALVTNSGVIEAAGGSVLITAHAASGLVEDLVSQTGRISAPTVGTRAGEVAIRAEGGGVRVDGRVEATGGRGERGGQIAAQATGTVTVAAGARVDASGGAGGGRVLVGTTGRGRDQRLASGATVERGAEIRADATGRGRGGEIVVNSTDRTEMRGLLSARGGAAGGDGGFIEVSGQGVFVLNGLIDLRAPAGALGDFLLDPRNIVISASATPSLPGTTPTIPEVVSDLSVVAGSVDPAGTVSADADGANTWVRITPGAIESFAAGNIILDADRQIIVDSAVNRTTAGDLTLRAGQLGGSLATNTTVGDITVRTGADISVNGALTLTTPRGAISIDADLRATAVTLTARNGVTQSGGNIQHVTDATTALPLTVTVTNGAVALARAGNGNFDLAASSASDNFTIAADTLAIAGNVSGATVSLTARTGALTLVGEVRATDLTLAGQDGIAQTGGNIQHRADAGTVLAVGATSAAGDVVLDAAGNGNLSLRAGGAQGAFTVVADTIATTGPITAGALTLTADTGALSIGGNIRATSVELTGREGITQSVGTIAHAVDGDELPITANASAGAILLAQEGNGVFALGESSADAGLTIAAEGLRITGPISGTDVALTARTDAITIDGDIRATGLTLEAFSGIRQIGGTIAHRAGASTTLDVAATLVDAGNIELGLGNGAIQISGGTVAGDFTLTSVEGLAIGAGGTLSVAGLATLTLQDGGTGITLAGELRALSVALASAGTISQAGTGVLVSRAADGSAAPDTALPVTVAVTGATHELILDGDNGRLSVVSATTEDGGIGIRARDLDIAGTIATGGTGGLTLITFDDGTGTGDITLGASSAITAALLVINAARDVTQDTLGSISLGAGRLTLRGEGADETRAGSLALAGTNQVGEVDLRTLDTAAGLLTGAIDVTLQGSVSVVQADGAAVAITASGITVAAGEAGVTATGDVRLAAGTLAIDAAVEAGTGSTLVLRTDTLALSGTGSLSVSGGMLELGPSSTARIVEVGGVADTGRLQVAAAALDASGATTIRLGSTTLTGTVTGAGVVVSEALTLGTGTTFEAVASGGIAVDAGLAAGTVRLTAGTDIALGAADVTARTGGIELRAGGAITQDATGALVAQGGIRNLVAHAGSGGIDLAGTGNFRLANGGTPAGAGGVRSLYATGDIAFRTTGTLTVAATAEANAPNATLTLQGSSIAIQAPLITPSGTGTVDLTATGAGGTISQTAAGTITASVLSATADGAVQLGAAPNVVATLGTIAFEDAFALRTSGALEINAAVGPTTVGADANITIRLDAGDLALSAAIAAGGGTVVLAAEGGDILQSAFASRITAGRLEVTAGGDATLLTSLGGGNAVAELGTSSVGGTLAFNAVGDLALDGTIAQSLAGGTLQVAADGALTVNAGAALGFETITLVASQAMALGGTVGLTAGAPSSTVRLSAGADITQPDGRIVAAALGVIGSGDATLTSATNDVRAIAATMTGTFALTTTGALATTTLPDVPGWGAAPGTGGVRGSSVTLTAGELTVAPTTLLPLGAGIYATAVDGVVRLRADRLSVTAPIAAGLPFPASPDFDGTIDIAPRTLARPVNLGIDTDPTGSLFLSGGALLNMYARTLVIGHDDPGAGALGVTGPVSTLFIDRATLQGGSIAINSTFTLPTSGGLLSLHATAGDIVQGTAGSLNASRLSAVADAGSVLLGSPGGAVNAVGQVSGSAGTNADFTFRGNGDFIVAAPGITVAGGDVDLSSVNGGIAQTTGARITAARLRVGAPGEVALDGGGSADTADLNSVGTLAPSSAGSLTLRNAVALRVEGATATAGLDGSVTLEAPGITLAGDITANQPGGHVVLRTGASFDAPVAGTIQQESGVIRAEGLSASAGTAVVLGGANEIARLIEGTNAAGGTVTHAVVTAPGGVVLLANNTANLEVSAPVNVGALGTISILADGLSVAPGLTGTVFLAPGGVVQFAPFTPGRGISLGGAGGVNETTISAAAIQRVSTGRLIIGALAPEDQVSSGTITLRGALDLTGAAAPQVLELRAAGDILADGFALSVPNISAVATGNVRLGTADSFIGQVVASAWDGVSGIRAGGPVVSVASAGADAATGLFTLAAPISLVGAGAGGTITLQAPDFAILAGATVDTGAAGRIEVRSPRTLSLGGGQVDDGTARLTGTELARLDANGGTLAAFAPDIRLRGAWTIDPTAASRLELGLTAGGTGTIRQIAGGLSVGELFVTALQGAGTVVVNEAGNALPVVSVQALGNINIATDGALEIRRTTTSGGTVTYRGTDITLSDAGLAGTEVTIDNAGRGVSLTATAGDITGTAAQAAVRAGTLTAAAAAGEIRLSGGNTITTAALSAADGILLRATGATTVSAVGGAGAGTEVAGTIDIAATALTLNDVLGSGTVLLDATTGDLLQNAGARLSAATLSAEAAGTLRLAGANGDGTARNTIQDLTALSAGGDITLRNALALTLDLPISVGVDRVLTLEAAGLTLVQNLAAAGPTGQIILRTGSFNGGVASGGDISQTGGTISAAYLAALAGGSIDIDRGGNAIGTLGGGRSANDVAFGLGLSAGGDATLRSNGFGGSATLGVTGALQVGPGRTLTLRADDLAIGAQLRAPGGVIALLPVTADGSIGYVLGGAAGSTNAGRITLDSTELGFLPSAGAAAELRLGALGQTGSVDIAGTVDLVDGAAPRVGLLALAGDGALTQGAGTLLDVAALSANFPNGAVLLDPGVAGNRIQALAGVTAGGAVDVRGGAGLMEVRGSGITAASGTSITLRADDLDLQAALRAAGGTVFILPETLGRSITLGGPDAAAGTLALGTSEIARIGGNGVTPALRLVIGADGAPGAPGTVRAAGDILVAGDVRLRAGGTDRVGTLELVAGTPGAPGGSVRQSAGSVDVAALTGTAQGDFQLGRPANAFDTAAGITAGTLPAAGAPGEIVLGTGDALAANDITGPVSVRLAAGGALTVGGITAPQVTLEGATVSLVGLVQGSNSVAIESVGGVSQAAGALIVTGLFTVNGGSISLPEDNQILELNGLVATGPVLALNTVLPVLVSGTVSAVGSLSLTTDQGLTVAPGGSISVTGGPGNATFEAGGTINYAGELAATGAATLTAGGALSFTGTATTGGALSFGAGAGLTLAGTIASGGAFTGTATGAIDLAGSLTAVGSVTIDAATSLTATGSVIAGSDLRMDAATGAVSLSGIVQAGGTATVVAGGAIGTTASVAATGDIDFTAGGTLTVSGRIQSTGGDVALTGATGLAANGTFIADGAARLAATTGALTLDGTLTAGGTVDVTAGGALGTTAQVTAGDTATFAAGGTLTASGRIQSTGGDVALTGAAGLTTTATLVANRNATLRATGGAASLTGSLFAGAAATVEAAGALTSNGTVQAGTTLAMTGGGTVTLGGTHVAGTSLGITAGGAIAATGLVLAGQGATLAALGGDLTQGGTVSAGGNASLSAGGNLANTGSISAGGTLVLASGGALSQTGGAGAGTSLAITAGGAVLLSGQTTAGTDLDVTTPGTATLTAGKITAGNAVRLTAGASVLAQSFQIDPATILLQTGGAMSLTDSSLVSGESIRLGAGSITLRRTNFTTGTLDVDATGSMVLDGGLFTIGRAVGFSAPGGIQTLGRITVVPGGGLLPAVVFDTRTTPAPNPLTIVEPDQPGLPARQQPTQVRVPGTEAPGDFGPASGAPAGTMVLNIDAGRSAIFLLLDGGTATGQIASAGRLAIHGTGGSAELTGRLTDVSGSPVDGAAAARFADSTRPAASGALTRYRLNGCVVSSVNCIVPSQIITIPQAPPQQVDLRLGNNRITDPEVQVPNVGDEDY